MPQNVPTLVGWFWGMLTLTGLFYAKISWTIIVFILNLQYQCFKSQCIDIVQNHFEYYLKQILEISPVD